MTHTTHTETMTFVLTLGRLAEEYGVPLEGGFEEYADADVEIYTDENGERCIHCREIPELPETWAPATEEMAAQLRAAAAAALPERVFFDEHGRPWSPCSSDHPAVKSVGPTGCARPRGDVAYRRHWPARWIFWDDAGWNWASPRSGCAQCGALVPTQYECLECSALIAGEIGLELHAAWCSVCYAEHEAWHAELEAAPVSTD